MVTILLAPDKFKGSLTAEQVCLALETGLRSLLPSLKIISHPLADGGEGTCALLTNTSGGSFVSTQVLDPLFRKIESGYGISPDGKTAFIEMSKASGLYLLDPNERNPMKTTTWGTGQLIKHAMDHGASHIVLGLGGSATNDAGIGMAGALGYSFLSVGNEKLKPIGENLIHLASIDSHAIHPLLAKTSFTVLCDVEHHLFGPEGAAHVFGPQKGASVAEVENLDSGLRQFKRIVAPYFIHEVDFPGAGAAGGLGAGASVFLNATLLGGFEFMAEFTHLEDRIKQADLVVTGEGKMDEQTLSGKVVKGVAALAAQHGKPCIAFAGKCELTSEEIQRMNIQEVITISNDEIDDKEAMTHAFSLLKQRAVTHLGRWVTG